MQDSVHYSKSKLNRKDTHSREVFTITFDLLNKLIYVINTTFLTH